MDAITDLDDRNAIDLYHWEGNPNFAVSDEKIPGDYTSPPASGVFAAEPETLGSSDDEDTA